MVSVTEEELLYEKTQALVFWGYPFKLVFNSQLVLKPEGGYKKVDDNSSEKKKYHHFGDKLKSPAIQGSDPAVEAEKN
jgi:hypothetical protein